MKMTEKRIICVCGCAIQKRELRSHKTSKKHIKLMSKGYHFLHPNGDVEFVYETN